MIAIPEFMQKLIAAGGLVKYTNSKSKIKVMPGRELQDHRRVEQMDLYYKSTRNSNLKVTASEAILKGLARTEGFLCWEKLPVLGKSMEELEGI